MHGTDLLLIGTDVLPDQSLVPRTRRSRGIFAQDVPVEETGLAGIVLEGGRVGRGQLGGFLMGSEDGGDDRGRVGGG
jgi:hypothetical protein